MPIRIRAIVFLALAFGLACNLLSSPTPTLAPFDESELETRAVATFSAGQTQTAAAPSDTPTPAGPESATGDPSAPEAPADVTALPAVRRIAYADDGFLWLIEADGAPHQLTETDQILDVRLSDDGARIAFVRQPAGPDTSELRAIRSDGSEEIVLLSQDDLNALYPLDIALRRGVMAFDFIPGSHDLLVNTRAFFEGPGLFKYDDLLRINSDDGTLTELLAPGEGGDFVVSPDGNKVVLVRPDQIGLVDPDGSHLQSDLISFSPIITYSEYSFYPWPVWAPDSSAFVVVIPSPDPLAPEVTSRVARVDAASGAVEELATFNGDSFWLQRTAPVIDPGLTWLAFQQPASADSVNQLLVGNLDGSDAEVIAHGPIDWRGWSPDGQHFLFGLETPANLQLGRVGADPTPLPDGTRPQWMTNDSFLYLSGSVGAWSLERYELGIGNTLITDLDGDFVSFDVAP
jgi:hypothetical protein